MDLITPQNPQRHRALIVLDLLNLHEPDYLFLVPLTCMSTLSRNHYVGTQIAAGKSLDQIRSEMESVAEGVDTTRAALDLAASLGVEMPIAQATYSIMYGGVSVSQAVQNLMGREPRSE